MTLRKLTLGVGRDRKKLLRYNKSIMSDLIDLLETTRELEEVQVHLLWAVINLTINQKKFVRKNNQ